jgi:hypothetical protein
MQSHRRVLALICRELPEARGRSPECLASCRADVNLNMMSAFTSSPADRDSITALLSAALGIGENAPALDPNFQQWKYWGPHPLIDVSRSHILKEQGSVVAHGCVWPIQLCAPSGSFKAFHLIDWAARRDIPGAGMQVLRQCCCGMAAMFSIGGSAMTRKILPAFGFKPYNHMTFLHRPLRPLQRALRESPADWKMPARVLHNLYMHLYPSRTLPEGWHVSPAELGQIPESLWPTASAGVAVSQRSSQLLTHVMTCPAIRRSACGLLSRGTNPAAAYLLLVQVRNQVRLADYGPSDLDEETSRILGLGAQALALSLFPDATAVIAATSELPTRYGFLRSGFRLIGEEPIKVLKLDKSLSSIASFRLTLLDWDALCL